MQSIEKRVCALEAAKPADLFKKELANMPAADAQAMLDDGEFWTRLPGESEQNFTDRAIREVKRNKWGNARLIASESKEPSHAIN